jgi:hypothetical protein
VLHESRMSLAVSARNGASMNKACTGDRAGSVYRRADTSTEELIFAFRPVQTGYNPSQLRGTRSPRSN